MKIEDCFENEQVMEILNQAVEGKRLGINLVEFRSDHVGASVLYGIRASPPGQIFVITSNYREVQEVARAVYSQGIPVMALSDFSGNIDNDALGGFLMNRIPILVSSYDVAKKIGSFICINSVHVATEIDEDYFVSLIDNMTRRLGRKFEEVMYFQYVSEN